MDFKVGDRVRIKIGAVDMSPLHNNMMRPLEGKFGTIKEILGNGDCRVSCGVDYGYTWWWKPCALEPVASPVCIPKPTWRIIIEGDENTSRAKYITGKNVIKEVSAKRYHTDKHDPAMAAHALMAKMFPDIAKPDNPPTYFTGKAVCVRPSELTTLERGKIYDFSLCGGRGADGRGGVILSSPARDIEEIKCRLCSEFLEIKED